MSTTEKIVWLNKREAAEYLRMSTRTIEKWMKEGKLISGQHYRKIGYKTLLFNQDFLNKLS